MHSSPTSIVVVNWNGAAFLPELLESIHRESVAKTIVIDNASSDNSIQILSKFPEVSLVANSENRGYGAAANQGIELSGTAYVLLLNVDMKVLPGAIGLMEEYLALHPDVALVAPQLKFANGSLQPSIRSFPTARFLALYLSYLDRIVPSNYRKEAIEHAYTQDIDQPMGAAMMLRRSVLEEIGFFDPHFFLYMEEVDLCYRIKQKGYRIVYLPQAQMIHYAGGSSDRDWERSQSNFLDSVMLYFRKHSPADLRTFRLLLPLTLLMRALILLFRGRLLQSKFYLSKAIGAFHLSERGDR